MQYHGKLFGKVGGTYFPLTLTSDDVDGMESALSRAEGALREIAQEGDGEQCNHGCGSPGIARRALAGGGDKGEYPEPSDETKRSPVIQGMIADAISRAEGALKRYGRHDDDCGTPNPCLDWCSCGLLQTLAGRPGETMERANARAALSGGGEEPSDPTTVCPMCLNGIQHRRADDGHFYHQMNLPGEWRCLASAYYEQRGEK